MCAGSTESYYVSFETAKILKKRGYMPDYDGRDKAYSKNGALTNLIDESVFPMTSWQDAFRFLRERWGVYAYVKRDTYHQKFRWEYERDSPKGTHTSAVYDTIDEARCGLFKEIDERLIPRILEDPSFYKYSYFSEEEKAEGEALREESHKRWIVNHLKKNPQDIQEYFKSHPEKEEEYMREINEGTDKEKEIQ